MIATEASKHTRGRVVLLIFWAVLVLSLLIAAVVFVLSRTSYRIMRMNGDGMHPMLQEGDVVRIDDSAYANSAPQRGDIIVFSFPGDEEETWVKRVIGLPGDEIIIEGEQLFLNGLLLNEAYLEDGMSTTGAGRWVVPEGNYFVLGDNRAHSADSRAWGLLTADKIIGKVIEILQPSDRRQTLLEVSYD